MLEDSFADVLKKAIRGLDLAPSLAAERSGLPVAQVRLLLQENYLEAPARRLAASLSLDGGLGRGTAPQAGNPRAEIQPE